jgi:hypothetical protein
MKLVAGNLLTYISCRLPKISPDMGNEWRYLIKLQETKNKFKISTASNAHFKSVYNH